MALNANPIPPSPIPPYHRPVVSPLAQTLTSAAAISLSTLTTYLATETPADAGDESVPYEIQLPDGNHKEQTKDIIIPSPTVENTAVWRVVGNFVDAVALQFDGVHQSASLKWDGNRWHMIGGNALKTDS